MVYTENTETWCQCDNCTLTMFAGFNAQSADVKHSFEAQGWTFGKRVLCDLCSKDPFWVQREMSKIRKGA